MRADAGKAVEVIVRAEKKSDGFVSVCCPLHHDQKPSASLLFRDGEPVALFCFGPCAGGQRHARFRVLAAEAVPGGWRLKLSVSSAKRGEVSANSAKNKGRAKSDGKARMAEADGSLVTSLAIDLAARIAREWLEAGKKTDERTFCLWQPFLIAKSIPIDARAIASLPYAPIFTPTAIAYPLLRLDRAPDDGSPRRYHLRLAAGVKGLFHPPGTSDAGVWVYAPRGIEPGGDAVITEAPHQALRIALLRQDVFPIAALGIGNLLAVVREASKSMRIAVVFSDDPVGVPGAIAVDIDDVGDRLASLIASRLSR